MSGLNPRSVVNSRDRRAASHGMLLSSVRHSPRARGAEASSNPVSKRSDLRPSVHECPERPRLLQHQTSMTALSSLSCLS
jgi:hypothetical protein